MKKTDIKVGMKVKIPKTKQGMTDFYSSVVNLAKGLNQDFLYVTRVDENRIVLNEMIADGGDYFYASELEEYDSKGESYSISKEFILLAHRAACSGWKVKIEQQVPELFRNNLMKELMKLVKVKPHTNSTYFIADIYLVIELPWCNGEWTLDTWKFITEVVEAIGGIPVHGKKYINDEVKAHPDFDHTSEYQLVDISEWLKKVRK
jgi:hypothetical protein